MHTFRVTHPSMQVSRLITVFYITNLVHSSIFNAPPECVSLAFKDFVVFFLIESTPSTKDGGLEFIWQIYMPIV